jgi:hypothetical protein
MAIIVTAPIFLPLAQGKAWAFMRLQQGIVHAAAADVYHSANGCFDTQNKTFYAATFPMVASL